MLANTEVGITCVNTTKNWDFSCRFQLCGKQVYDALNTLSSRIIFTNYDFIIFAE